MYLENHGGRGAVDVVTLPVRTAAGVGVIGAANTIAHTDDNDYQNYAARIDAAVYNAQQLNGFVAEICGKINQQRD